MEMSSLGSLSQRDYLYFRAYGVYPNSQTHKGHRPRKDFFYFRAHGASYREARYLSQQEANPYMRYEPNPYFYNSQYHLANHYVQPKGAYGSPNPHVSTPQRRERVPPPPWVRARDIVCVMCEGRGHLADICPNQYYTYKDEGSLESEVLVTACKEEGILAKDLVDKVPKDEDVLATEPMVKGEEIEPKKKQEDVVETSPSPTRSKHRPTIARSSPNSLATPWMDATPMVPSYLPFSPQEEVHPIDVKPSKEINFGLEKEKTHLREVSHVSTFRIPSPLLEYEYFSRGREFHVLKYVFIFRTRYSCIHQSSFAQYMSCGMHLVHTIILHKHVCYVVSCTPKLERRTRRSGILFACMFGYHVVIRRFVLTFLLLCRHASGPYFTIVVMPKFKVLSCRPK